MTGGKPCTGCGCAKQAGDFYFRSSGKPDSMCKECVKARVRRLNAPEVAANQIAREAALKAREGVTHKTCVKCGEQKMLEDFYAAARGLHGRRADCKACNVKKALAWAARNPERVKAIAARKPKDGSHYRTARRQCPKWADKAKIRAVYAEAKAAGLWVDHIYPLRGKLVSGLHVHQNLRPLSRPENQAKFNKMPDLPEAAV